MNIFRDSSVRLSLGFELTTFQTKAQYSNPLSHTLANAPNANTLSCSWLCRDSGWEADICWVRTNRTTGELHWPQDLSTKPFVALEIILQKCTRSQMHTQAFRVKDWWEVASLQERISTQSTGEYRSSGEPPPTPQWWLLVATCYWKEPEMHVLIF